MKINGREYPNVKLDVIDLKGWIVTQLIEWSQNFLNQGITKALYIRKPHWRKSLVKKLEQSRFLLGLAKPASVDYLLRKAIEHFDENSRHRAYNILLEKCYIRSLLSQNEKKQIKRYHYYLAIRIAKARFNRRKGRSKVLTFVGSVRQICPMGQVIHLRIGDAPSGRQLLGKSILGSP